MGQRQAHYTTRRFREPLDDVLDRPIAFNPAFKKITGSTVAALMLSQAWYWSKRTSSEDGWFYKTIEEWEDETGLTRSEQETARKHLKRFMEVDLRGVPATLFYRLNKQEIYDALGVQFAETLQTSLPESSILVSDIPANINRNTEITAETTQTIVDSTNKTVDAMLEQERLSIGRVSYPKRESLPEPIRELLDGWVKATGMKPLSKDVFHWMNAMNDWLELGVQVADIAPAYEAVKDKFAVLTPHSLTNTLRARKAQPAKSNFESEYL